MADPLGEANPFENAFHAFVDTVVIGMGWVVFEEREQYETLKYVYASPVGIFTYLAGRASVKFVLAAISWLAIQATRER